MKLSSHFIRIKSLIKISTRKYSGRLCQRLAMLYRGRSRISGKWGYYIERCGARGLLC